MFFKDKYKNRVTVDKKDYNQAIMFVVFIYTMFFLLVMVGLGYITRQQTLNWPIPQDDRLQNMKIVTQVQAVEVEKEVYVTPETIEQKIRATFPEDPDTAVAISRCESGMKESAFNGKNTNGSWDAGLMQINSIHGVSKHMLMDVDVNLAVARQIYERAGNTFNPWVCYHKVKK